MHKKNIITTLTVLLVLQGVLIALLYRPAPDQSPPAVALMATVDVKTISAMRITDENGRTVTLQKQGPEWTVGEEKFPADKASVELIIAQISGLESARLVSRTKSSHNRLKVGDGMFNRKVVLGSEKGDVTFFMGTAPSSKSVHLRVAGQNETYQVTGISAWELQADSESWWETNYLQLEPEAIQAVTITNGNGIINLTRDADTKQWQAAGEGISGGLDQNKVSVLLEVSAKIAISDYLPKDFAMATPPVCTIEYLVDNKNVALQIWPKSAEEDHVVKLSGAAFYAKMRNYSIEEVLDATIQGLVAEEVPDPGASPGPAAE
jgi:hypothetical protein